jgi:hypothetical protein
MLSKALKRRRTGRRPSAPAPPAATPVNEDAAMLGYFRGHVQPRPTQAHDNYVPSFQVGTQGLELNERAQLARLAKWRGEEYQGLYELLRNDEQINCPFAGKSYLGSTCLHNGWYPTPDAEIYASMIYDLRPDKIVEVGSGFSTLVARRAKEYARHKAPLAVIDPAPRTDVTKAADQVILKCVEDVRLDAFALTGKSLLFIDSSHVTRVRGDVPYLYCQVLPQLPSGTVVHVHDIFIPYDYPTNYDPLCWTEQYLLHTLLAHSPRYEILMATQYMTRHHTHQMQATFGPQVGTDELFYGASFWFQVR